MELQSHKKQTIDFLKSFNLEPGNLDYLNEKYISDNASAAKPTQKILEIGKAKIDPKILEENSKVALPLSQWSGYVYSVSQVGDKLYFYTSCGVTGTPQYYINTNQIVSIKQTGLCYQYTLYYLVFNY
jgi:hypothetical protein